VGDRGPVEKVFEQGAQDRRCEDDEEHDGDPQIAAAGALALAEDAGGGLAQRKLVARTLPHLAGEPNTTTS